jgi:hypothetical protein
MNQSGPVFFVAGRAFSTVERRFNVPAGKYVLLPLINWVIASPDPGFSDTATEADSLTTGTLDPSMLFATFDGERVSDLASHREKSPLNFTLNAVDGVSGFPAGTYTDANSDGYWLMLAPLSAGGHTLHFGGTTNDYSGPNSLLTVRSFFVNVRDRVTVEGAATVPLPPAVFASLPLLSAMGLWHLRRR